VTEDTDGNRQMAQMIAPSFQEHLQHPLQINMLFLVPVWNMLLQPQTLARPQLQQSTLKIHCRQI